uniref:Putative secreted protein n=1 Tax=Ixodes ricinus TaxID=34613 RepID=A0A090X9K4_IXORI
MRLLFLLCTISAYQMTGASPSADTRLDDFFAEVFLKTQYELTRRNPNGRKIFIPSYLDDDSGVSVYIGTNPYAIIFGLDYKFQRNGRCITKVEQTKHTFQCPVTFSWIRIVLPRAVEETTQYVVHVEITGKVVLEERSGIPNMRYKRFTRMGATYLMFDSNYNPVSYPDRYSLKTGKLRNLRGILESRLGTFLGENEQLSDCINAALRAVKNPPDLRA